MSNQLDPVVTQWYQYRDEGTLFEVIAVDDRDGTVDIQDFDNLDVGARFIASSGLKTRRLL